MGWNDRLGLTTDEEVEAYIAGCEEKADRDRKDEAEDERPRMKERGSVRRVREALDKGERDDQLLSGRDFDRRYWTAARRALSTLRRELDVAERERDALRAVMGERPE